jgi:hypothetical protein
MKIYLREKLAAPVYKSEINGRGVSAALTTRHPSSPFPKIFVTKTCRPVAVARSVYFACGLKAKEFLFSI